MPIRRISPGSEGSSTTAYEEGEKAFESYLESSDEDALTTFLKNSQHQPENIHDLLVSITEDLIEWVQQRSALNLNLLDYLGNYSSGKNLIEVSGYQPAMGASESILSETTESYENLRVGKVEIERAGAKTIVKATARYKPEDEEGYETDQWGYTETDPVPIMEFVGVGEKKRELLQEFVPYAVDESGGFANFRENATKTNSLIDRLNAIELPNLDDVQDGLEQFITIKGRATELDNKIEKSERGIDHLIYRLYDLSEDEIGLVENTSG